MTEPASIRTEWRGPLRWVTLVRGRGNALDPPLLAGLAQVLATRPAPPTLLSAQGRSFCTGLDLDHALGCDRVGMRAFILAFHATLRAAFAYPAPLVAAISGHALAGGALLTATCDRRVMADGEARWGIHGAHLGITLPHVAVEVVRYQFGRAAAERILYAGSLLRAPRALAGGLVDRVVPPGELMAAARTEIEALPSGAAFAATKLALRGPTLRRLDQLIETGEEAWLDRWFDPDTRRRIQRARSLRPSSGPASGADPA